MRRFTTAAAAAFAAALALGLGTGASAQETADDLELTAEQKADLDTRADEALRNSKPGGERIAPDKIAWDDGDVVLTLAINGKARDNRPAGPDGRVYLYDNLDFTGDSLSFYECKYQKLRWYDFTNKTSSWINNQYKSQYSQLQLWSGSEVYMLDAGLAVYSRVLAGEGGGDYYNNKADFLDVCAS